MKTLICTILALATLQPVMACEFTSLKAHIKVEARTLDYVSHKEKIQKVGSTKGSFVGAASSSHRVFQMGKKSLPLLSLNFKERYDFYVTSITTDVSLSGPTMAEILTEAIGEKKLKKNANLAAFVKSVADNNPSIGLHSYFYKFSGYSYGEVDDESEDSFTVTDPANQDNKLIVTVDFARKVKCD